MVSKTVTAKLSERPTNVRISDDQVGRQLPVDGVGTRPFGLTLSELTPALATAYKLEGQKGLLIRDVSPASFIADIRSGNGSEALGEGDLIQRINRVDVTDMVAFTAMASKLKVGDPVVLQVLSYNPVLHSTQLKIVQFSVK